MKWALLLCGDLNCCIENIDRNTKRTDHSSNILKGLLLQLNLEDSFRFLIPNLVKFSYSNNSGTYQSLIDYICVSKYMNGQTKWVDIKNVPKIPDHKAVVLSLNVNYNKGPGYWKLNISWLENQEYIDSVIDIIKNTVKDELNPYMIWDLCKIKIKEFSIKFCHK